MRPWQYKTWSLGAVGASLLSAHTALGWTPTGRFFSNAYVPTDYQSDHRLIQSDLEAWLGITHSDDGPYSVKATVTARRLQRNRDGIESDPADFGVREAYGRYAKEGWDLQAGKLLLPWGKADGINPTDYFSAKDFTVANPDEEVRRRGPIAAVAAWTPKQGASPYTVTAVIAPVFARSTLLIPASAIPVGVTVLDPVVLNIAPFNRLEAAAKIAYTGEGWDASFSAFNGWNHLPDLQAPAILSATQAQVTPTFHRLTAFGGDYSVTTGDYVLRAEAAYKITEDRDGSSGLIAPSSIEGVVGAERPFGDDWRVQLQLTYRYYPSFSPIYRTTAATNQLTAAAASMNALMQGYQYRSLPGATARIGYTKPDGNFEAEVFGLTYYGSFSQSFSGQPSGIQFLIRPKVTYKFTEAIKASVGMDEYFGPAQTTLGEAETYRSVFMEASYVSNPVATTTALQPPLTPAPLPPGPRTFGDIIKVIGERKKDPFALYQRLIREYGDVVYFKVGSIAYCLVNDPECIKKVLHEGLRNYPKGPGYERLRVLLGQGLLTGEGEPWKRQRKLAQPAFHQARIVEFSKQVARIVAEFVAEWDKHPDGHILDLASEMNRLAMRVVGETLLGSDPTARAGEITQCLLDVLRFSDARGMTWLRLIDVLMPGKDRNLAFKLEQKLPTRANRAFHRSLKTLNELILGVVEKRRQEIRDGAPPRQDFLSLFMVSEDEDDGSRMNDQQLRDEVMSVFLAGHETTATALTWTFHLLAHHQNDADRMRAEIDAKLGAQLPEMMALADLEFTNHVFSESIRYYPPFWRFTRQAVKEDRLGGFAIPEGTVMIVSPYITHRNAKHWTDGDSFKPARFEEPAHATRHKFAYIPFGGGPRVCIGSNFAVMEAMMILTQISQKYILEAIPGHELKFEANITLRPAGGLPMKLVRRGAR